MDRRAAYRQILIVFLILMVLTIFEFRLAIVTEGSAALLFIVALVKAALIVNFFMHIYRLWRPESH